MTTALGGAAEVAEIATRSDLIDLGVAMKRDIDAMSAEFGVF